MVFGLGIALAILMVMCTPASAGSSIELSKETLPNPSAVYNIGDTITYEVIVTNPGGAMYAVTLEVNDEFPNGNVIHIGCSINIGSRGK